MTYMQSLLLLLLFSMFSSQSSTPFKPIPWARLKEERAEREAARWAGRAKCAVFIKVAEHSFAGGQR